MRKVLIVEDDFSLVQILKTSIKCYIDNCEIFTASDGEKAIAMITNHKPDVVVLDVYLPKTNGFEVYQKIKLNDEFEDVSFLIMSGRYSSRELNIINKKLQAEKMLHKPFEMMDFIKALKSLLPPIRTDSDLIQELKRVKNILNKKEEEITNMKNAWNQLISTTNDGIWDWDLRAEEISYSQKFCEILGINFDQSNSLKPRLTALVNRDDAQNIHNRIQAYLNKEIPRLRAETQMRCGDGNHKWIELSGTALWNEYGNPYRIIGTITDISIRKDLEARIEKMAYHDSLTQLPNEELLFDRANQVFATAERYDQLVSIIYINIDDLNNINTTAGNFVGDTLLRQTAVRLLHCVRNIDTVARIGGDEFVILLPNVTEKKNASIVAHRIKEKISHEYHIGKKKFALTASMGLTFFPFPATDFARCLKIAEFAMKLAKKNGKNQIQIVTHPNQLEKGK